MDKHISKKLQRLICRLVHNNGTTYSGFMTPLNFLELLKLGYKSDYYYIEYALRLKKSGQCSASWYQVTVSEELYPQFNIYRNSKI